MQKSQVKSIVESYNRAIIANREGWKEIHKKQNARSWASICLFGREPYNLPPSLPAPLSMSIIKEAQALGLKLEN